MFILSRWRNMPVNKIEFFLNDFIWIQWIMSKSENAKATRNSTQLATHTLLARQVKNFDLQVWE